MFTVFEGPIDGALWSGPPFPSKNWNSFVRNRNADSPAWLPTPPGPDVSPHLRWYPIITFLQIAFDIPMATTVPIGHGHNYSPSCYIDGWVAVTQPKDISLNQLEKLKEIFRSRATPKP